MNALPYLAMWLTCTAWIIYSIFLNDLYVFSASLPGAAVSIFYLVVACSVCNKTERLQVCIGWILSFSGLAIVAMATVALKMSSPDMSDLWGWVANLTLVFFYASPLSTALRAIADRDSSSFHPRLAITETAYGAVWTAYGAAVADPHIWAPNVFGAAFGAAQLLLLLLLPRRQVGGQKQEGDEPAATDVEADSDGAQEADPLLPGPADGPGGRT